jgi:RNA polymerase sigma-70 factor (ECF subfamily)
MTAVPARDHDTGGPGQDPSTEALVRQAQQGDPEAYEQVYRRLAGRVYALCLRMTADGQRAEELTQDAFVRAWERLGSFRGDSRFSTWLHRLTVNLVLQDRRTQARRAGREAPMPEGYAGAVREAFPGTRIDLERGIAALPDGARQVLVLRDVQGYKYREVAEMVGVTVGTVKAQIHRARKLLRETLER